MTKGKYLYSIQVMELKGDIMHYIYKLTFPGTQRQYIKNAKCFFVFDLLNYSLLNLRVKGDGARGGLFTKNLNYIVCLAKRNESTHPFYCYK